MKTLAAKKKKSFYTQRYIAIIFRCRRLKIVKLDASRGDTVFWFWSVLYHSAKRDSKPLSCENEHF